MKKVLVAALLLLVIGGAGVSGDVKSVESKGGITIMGSPGGGGIGGDARP